MRPQRPQVFYAETSAKLDRLELIAALLERDATNNRVLITELGAEPAPKARVRARLSRRWRALVDATSAGARIAVSVAGAIATSPRLHTVLRAVYGFTVDFAVVLATGCAAVAALTIAFLLVAPPA
jgi:hypothetical protein